MTYVRRKGRRLWLPAALSMLVVLAATLAATVPSGKASKSAASPIKIAILSDCQGAFASNYEQDIGGAITALAQFAGVKPKKPNKPSAGWTGGQNGGASPPAPRVRRPQHQNRTPGTEKTAGGGAARGESNEQGR